jgi:hypothetical protein
MKRKYEEVWQRIKLHNRATLADVHPLAYKRIKKAVIKEKDRDLNFKVLNENDYFRLKIVYDVAKKQLKFTLHQRLGLEDKRI